MSASLLDSQFAALEPPDADEPVIRIDVGPSPQEIARRVIDMLNLDG